MRVFEIEGSLEDWVWFLVLYGMWDRQLIYFALSLASKHVVRSFFRA